MKISAQSITETFVFSDYQQQTEYNPYSDSPFKLFQEMSSKKKGTAFEKLATEIFINKNYSVIKAKNSDYDRLINGKKVEIKGSLGWVVDGKISHYRFQQIRHSQDYEILMFMFFTPDELIIKGCSKETAIKNLSYMDENGHFPYNQHGGKKVNSGTFCIDTYPSELDWMVDFDSLF